MFECDRARQRRPRLIERGRPDRDRSLPRRDAEDAAADAALARQADAEGEFA